MITVNDIDVSGWADPTEDEIRSTYAEARKRNPDMPENPEVGGQEWMAAAEGARKSKRRLMADVSVELANQGLKGKLLAQLSKWAAKNNAQGHHVLNSELYARLVADGEAPAIHPGYLPDPNWVPASERVKPDVNDSGEPTAPAAEKTAPPVVQEHAAPKVEVPATPKKAKPNKLKRQRAGRLPQEAYSRWRGGDFYGRRFGVANRYLDMAEYDRLDPSELLVLLVMWLKADPETHIVEKLSYERIAKLSGLNKGTVRRKVQGLLVKRVIRRKSRGTIGPDTHDRRTPVYKLQRLSFDQVSSLPLRERPRRSERKFATD